MASLNRDARKALEKACAEARAIAEGAAEKAMRGLAVGERTGHVGVTTESEKVLRYRLRAHGRQLGDKLNVEKGTQEIDRLVSECAYEQWHRMLFARFLAENELLIEPKSGMSITVDEVKELARDEGVDWMALAGNYAVSMLPQVFRTDDPVLGVQFAPEDRKQLEELLQSLSPAVFHASDSLGWCYQFWQAEKKAQVNAAGNKIGADELPSVTQLFTEDYMVDFLLDNTLGAWHAGKVLAARPKLAEDSKSEDELRHAIALPGCPWTYLRFIKGEDSKWTPAAGTFDGWPKAAASIRALDPCMGSGHFVVAMFERLVALRLAEETLDEAAAVAAVIRDNLFGLEIDPRCTQIGAFNLALAAWRRVGYCVLPPMNLACSGLAPNTREADWLMIAGDNEKLKNGMQRLHRLFQKAGVLGSLINPRAGEADLLVGAFHEIQPLLEKALARETKDETAHEVAVTARGLAKAAEILADQFTLVATNVPYLGRGKQNKVLQGYVERVYPDAKADLATCFVERCIEFCGDGGIASLVTPQNWFFLGSYKTLRRRLLRTQQWVSVARLGTGAFETISGEVVNVSLVSICKTHPATSAFFIGLDVSSEQSPGAKAAGLSNAELLALKQADQVLNPDSAVVLGQIATFPALRGIAEVNYGSKPGQTPRVTRSFWELGMAAKTHWRFMESSPAGDSLYSGKAEVCLSQSQIEQQGIVEFGIRGRSAWGKRGVIFAKMSRLSASVYVGEFYDDNTYTIIPKRATDVAALYAYVASDSFYTDLRRINQKLNVTRELVEQLPFDLAHWQKVAAEQYPQGLPRPFSTDPTQWLFEGHPAGADQPLHVAVARLLGYQWPRQSGSSFPDCPALSPDGLERLADDDGIVPIAPVQGEGPAAERLRTLLAQAYGEEWNAARQEALLAQVDYAGASLEDWLRNGFFEQHCAIFHNRPFIWHVWDGVKDGFHALVNYHNLCAANGDGHRTLEKLTYTYLGDWITFQRAEQKAGKEGSDGKLAAALHLQAQLKLILEGEPPFDVFVRWKPLHEQAVGWQPDINDGVRINIRPFMTATTLSGKSIFRKAPKSIKWDKDRGNEPQRLKQDFPWLWSRKNESTDFLGGREFDGTRWNDLHYSNGVKRAARESSKGKRR